MDPVVAGLIAMGVSGGVKALAGLFDKSAGQKAQLMRQEADLKQSSLEESLRRAEGAQTQVLSSTKSRMAGSGFSTDSGSFQSYLTGMASEFQKQDAFARESGMKAIDLTRKAADITDSDGLSKWLNFGADIFGTAGNILSTGKIG